MAAPDISQILAALAQQNQGGTPQSSSTPQQAPNPQALYGLPAQSPPAGAGYLPQPPSASSTSGVSIAEAIAKARGIAANRGVSSYDPRQNRGYGERSRSRSPARHDGGNPYRDDRRDDPRRGGYQRSPSPDRRAGYGGGAGAGGSETEQIRVKASLVGLIIGRNGENLRRVEGESGARVQFVQTKDPTVTERQCNITGPLRAREDAKSMIYQTIEDNGGQNIMKDGAAFAANSRPKPAQQQPALRDGEETFQLLVPDKTVGLIIGRGGETIKDIQEKSGCHVNIVGENKSINGQRPVNLIGSVRAVELAKQLIFEVVNSDSNSRAGGASGTGTNNIGLSRDRGAEQFGGRGGDDDSYEEKTIKVPSEAVGMIIGKGGETIKELQRSSGCKINVNQPKPPDLTRSIDLAGSRRSMAIAEKTIWEKVETVRQRDEAAGGPRRGNDSGSASLPPQQSYNSYMPPQQSAPSVPGYGAYGVASGQQHTPQMPFQMPFFPQAQQQVPVQQPQQGGDGQAGGKTNDQAVYEQWYASYMHHLQQQQQQGGNQQQ